MIHSVCLECGHYYITDIYKNCPKCFFSEQVCAKESELSKLGFSDSMEIMEYLEKEVRKVKGL